MDPSPGAEYCHEIVGEVSRTFAIGIGRLSDPLSTYICISYLLCRIPDTLEDSPQLSVEEKLDLLGRYRGMLDPAVRQGPDLPEFLAAVRPPTNGGSSWELVDNTDRVVETMRGFPESIQRHIRPWVFEMVEGMSTVLRAHEGRIRLASMDQFSDYCYYVAGTVGRLLTDLFAETREFSAARRRRLEKLAPQFGEGLQTVNILKDVHDDFVHEDAIYLPESLLTACGSSQDRLLETTEGTLRAARTLVEHAHEKLEGALEYIRAIPYEAEEIRDFCIVPYLLARSTLREIEQRTAEILEPSSVKIDREEVFAILAHTRSCVRDNEYLGELSTRAGRLPIDSPEESPRPGPG